MRVRLLTDGGYGLRHDEMSKIYDAKKKNSCYVIDIDGIEMYFYADEVEVIQDHVYFLEKAAEDKAAIKIIVVSILATILCIAAIIYVIF